MKISEFILKQRHLLAGGGGLLAWQIAALSGYMPYPLEVWKTVIQLLSEGDPVYRINLLWLVFLSMKVLFLGSAAAFLLATPLGLLLGYYRSLERFLEVYFELLRPIPPLAWIPVGYALFQGLEGPTFYVQILVVFVGAFFPCLTATIHGVRSLDPILLDAAYTLGAQKDWQVLLKVVLPSALPAIISGIKSGLGVAWMCIVAAEFVGGRMGIGAYIWALYNLGGRMTEIVIAVLTVGIVGCVMNKGISFLGRRVAPWHSW
jgi:NitT/TauT family transport system permease protein